MKKFTVSIVLITIMAIVFCSCLSNNTGNSTNSNGNATAKSNNAIEGTYLGVSGRPILKLEKDGICTYDYDEYVGGGHYSGRITTGTYEKQSDGSYKMKLKNYGDLQFSVEENGDIYLVSEHVYLKKQ